jgi:hypothetical protein
MIRYRTKRNARADCRDVGLESRGSRRTVVAVAAARELAGQCWALAMI